MFRSAKFTVRLQCCLNLRVEKGNRFIQRLLRSFPVLLAHLRGCNFTKIDWIVRIISPRPDRQIVHYFHEAFLSFLITPLRQVAIPYVAIRKKEKLVLGNVESGFLGEWNHFGLVALDDLRGTSAL